MTSLRFDRRIWRLSAQQAHPLSWFTGQWVPLAFGALTLLYGGTFVVINGTTGPNLLLQVIGVLLCTGACVLIHFFTRPMRARLGWRGAIAAVAVGTIGFGFSAVGYSTVPVAIELWWAPFGLALVLASLGPYLPVRTLLAIGGTVVVVAVPFAYLQVRAEASVWGPVSTAVIIAAALISGIVATAAFAAAVVGRTLPLLEKRTQSLLSLDLTHSSRGEELERRRLEGLISRAGTFIEGLAQSGVVTPADRDLAGQFARQLRDDLVAQSNLSWLDAVARDRIVVVDPDRQAGRMRSSQRTALRAFLRAILRTPGTDAGSLLVELRAQPDGSTAVGVKLDIELPEGRRVMHLAPYYLALRGSVDDLAWSDDKFLRLTFNLPAADQPEL
ncbi:MAG: hypothetical protein ABIR17_10165 [Pseudolysinimonas sp.]|uniref:hypothetical protein n=1 Tax=Pseudolysinimonas sp. TaxID=2680009 RepID=UPI0032652A08